MIIHPETLFKADIEERIYYILNRNIGLEFKKVDSLAGQYMLALPAILKEYRIILYQLLTMWVSLSE